jgi:hypothetical protein
LYAQQAALSTNHSIVILEGANHSSLVYQREHALQTKVFILRVLEAIRSGLPISLER